MKDSPARALRWPSPPDPGRAASQRRTPSSSPCRCPESVPVAKVPPSLRPLLRPGSAWQLGRGLRAPQAAAASLVSCPGLRGATGRLRGCPLSARRRAAAWRAASLRRHPDPATLGSASSDGFAASPARPKQTLVLSPHSRVRRTCPGKDGSQAINCADNDGQRHMISGAISPGAFCQICCPCSSSASEVQYELSVLRTRTTYCYCLPSTE